MGFPFGSTGPPLSTPNTLPVVESKMDASGRKGGDIVEVDIGKGVKMKFCWIPAGKATLGSPEGEKERSTDEAEHEYTSKGFWLAKYPVTQEQWLAVMDWPRSRKKRRRLKRVALAARPAKG